MKPKHVKQLLLSEIKSVNNQFEEVLCRFRQTIIDESKTV